MLEVWLPLLCCIVLGWTWFHVLRLRERAVAHARRLCEDHKLQLLDDSVSLHRLYPRWRRGSLEVLREYRFYTSRGGNDREAASITLLRGHIVRTSMPSREPFPGSQPVPPIRATLPSEPRNDGQSGNVVPIGRARRTMH